MLTVQLLFQTALRCLKPLQLWLVTIPMIMTRLPEPLLSAPDVIGGFSAVSTAVGPDGPRMSLACLGLRHLLGICKWRSLSERTGHNWCHNA